MNIHIIEREKDAHYIVNGKRIRKDMDGQWLAAPELTPREKQFFGSYLNCRNLE